MLESVLGSVLGRVLGVAIAAASCLLVGHTRAQEVRIDSLTDLHGIRENTLVGRGIVTGLRGTGDGTVATRQAFASYLARTNLQVRPDQVAAGNYALVNNSAKLPP
ncbi:MAG TPA: flagellar basal body P-ring protein FlgI, partial [Planctomycetota bacterium]|nr:flagellar basal body P-ring protein FlgI [Planctomycetota bacterium]